MQQTSHHHHVAALQCGLDAARPKCLIDGEWRLYYNIAPTPKRRKYEFRLSAAFNRKDKLAPTFAAVV